MLTIPTHPSNKIIHQEAIQPWGILIGERNFEGPISDVQVKKESNTISEPKQSLDLQRLSRRVRNAIEQKKILVSALQSGVSPDGQKLYMAISKTISNQVNWSGPNIQ
ncbi:hypothetical protein HA402_014748 [Bradysia odoriphaga]|nr:hypothetical protein HA402_014748 [Bradysia odoriphaga]